MKHLKHTLKTYMYSPLELCNILIYFYKIDIKRLQHTSETSETLETYAFSTMSHCCLDEWRLVVMKLNVGVEVTHGALQYDNGMGNSPVGWC
jgi:hypothetical protein